MFGLSVPLLWKHVVSCQEYQYMVGTDTLIQLHRRYMFFEIVKCMSVCIDLFHFIRSSGVLEVCRAHGIITNLVMVDLPFYGGGNRGRNLLRHRSVLINAVVIWFLV